MKDQCVGGPMFTEHGKVVLAVQELPVCFNGREEAVTLGARTM